MATVKRKETIEIVELHQGCVDFHILGTTPLILARLSEKAKHTLLLPAGKKTTADKKNLLKHNPIEEFRAAPYLSEDPDSDHLLELMATSFKRSMMGAALDIPGSTKAQIGRLVWVEGQRVGIYGVPKLFMSIVRSADINRTPDVRTRVIVPEWAAKIRVRFAMPVLSATVIANLIGAAGMIQGVGDWRPEKGSGNFGQFQIVSNDDSEFLRRLQSGRTVQQEAMDDPTPYDSETGELLDWFDSEVDRRGLAVA